MIKLLSCESDSNPKNYLLQSKIKLYTINLSPKPQTSFIDCRDKNIHENLNVTSKKTCPLVGKQHLDVNA